MTIPSTVRKAGPLLGTGAQTAWPFTFKVFAATDIAVTIADSLGVETALVLNTHYSVSLNANQDTSPGGTVTYPISGAALASGSVLTIVGDLDYDQPLDLPSGGNFSPLALENQLDRTVMQVQQLQERVNRALLAPVTTDVNVQLPAPESNALISWNTAADGLQNIPLESLATAIGFATMRYDTFVGDGATTQFALQADPATLGNLDVAIDGLTQVPGVDYTLVNQNAVFTVAPGLGAEVLVRYGQGLVVPTADANDVSYTPAGGTVRTVQDKLRESVSVLDFGAVGDGTTDDAVAIQSAINTGALNVIFPAGYTFLTSPLTTSIVGQKITAYGATIKLKLASSSHLFRALAAGVEVFGGTWDGNNVVSRTVLVLSASYCSVRFATVQNCGAAGIYGSTNASYLTIANNVIKDAVTYGIYVEGLTADCYGNKITDNDVDTSGTAAASGIYLTGNNALTYFQRQWVVRGNRVKGSTSTPTGAGITTRAIDGILSGNTTTGYTLGITADITSRSTITGNRVSETAGATSYCIEVNGDHNSITGNVTNGGRYGIILSSVSVASDNNAVSANIIEDPTVAGIFVSPGVSQTARYLSITGNNIDLSGSVTGRIGIYLVRDCAHTHISSNNIRGLGSGTANSRAVYLDTPPAAAHVNISNNKIVGFERAFTAYSAGALTVTDLTSHGNDLSSDVTQSSIGWTFEGSAVVGTRVTHTDSKNSAGSYTDVHDMLLNVFTLRSTVYNNPESNLAAGIGSLYMSLNSGQVPYFKSTGANTNTGWVALA